MKEFIRICPILPKDYLRKNYAFLGEKFILALEKRIDVLLSQPFMHKSDFGPRI